MSLALTCRFFYELLKPHLTNIINENSAIWRNRPLILMDENPSAQPPSVTCLVQEAIPYIPEYVTRLTPINIHSCCFDSRSIQFVHDREPKLLHSLFSPWIRQLSPSFVHHKEGWVLRNLRLKEYITYEGLQRVDVPGNVSKRSRRGAPRQWFLGMVVPPTQTHWYLGQALLAKILQAKYGNGLGKGEYDGGWAAYSLEICRAEHLIRDQKAGEKWRDVSTDACLAIEFLTNTSQLTLFPDEMADYKWDSWNYCEPGGARLAELMDTELMDT